MNCDQKLIQAFELTSTGQHIEQVESYFEQMSQDRLFLQKLFIVINHNDASLRSKIGAAGLLHKKIKYTLNEQTQIAQDYYDLNIIRQGIIPSIVNVQEFQVRKNLEEILTILINTFYPQNWPDLVQEIIQILNNSNSFSQILGNMRVIYCVSQSYRDSNELKQKKFYAILDRLFTYVENIAIKALKNGIEESFLSIQLSILKIFSNVVVSDIPNFMDDKKLKTWCYILKASWALRTNIQNLNMPTDYDQMYKLEKTEIFQIRIQSIQGLNRLCMIFSNIKKYQKTLLFQFIQLLPSIIEQGLNFLYQSVNEPNFISSLLETSEIYRMLFYSIQIHYGQQEREIFSNKLFTSIIYEFLIIHMQIHTYAQDLFADDEFQYIYSSKNMDYEPTMMLRRQVGNVLSIIMKNDNDFLTGFLEFAFSVISKQFNKYTNQPAELQIQESVLYGIESCIQTILDLLNKNMDNFVEKLIIPALNTNNPFLQAQACVVIENLKECEIKDMNLVYEMISRLCQFVQSENLYLKIQSIKALRLLGTMEETHEYFKNDLKNILISIFDTMQIIKIEDLSDCLRTFVEEFQDYISPYSRQITDNILQQFWEVAQNKDIDDIDDDIEQGDYTNSLESCLNTIADMFSCDLEQQFYEQSINWLTDIVAFVLTQKKVFKELQDSLLEVLSVFVFKLQQYDDSVFMFYPFLCYTLFGQPKTQQPLSNLDFMNESQKKLLNNKIIGKFKEINDLEKCIGIYGNFVQKGFDIIMNKSDFFGKRLLEYLFDFVDALIQKGMNENSDLELLYAIKTLSFLFENNYQTLLKDHQNFMFEICNYYQNLLSHSKSPILKSAIHQKYCQMLFLDSQASLNIWRRLGIYENVLYGIFGSLDLFIDVDDKSLLKLNSQDFPTIIPLSSLMRELLQVIVFLYEEHQKKILFEEEEISVRESEDDRTFNEECLFEEREFNYLSPFDQIDEIIELRKTLNEIEQKNIKYFQKLLGELSSNEQQKLKDQEKYIKKVKEKILNKIKNKLQIAMAKPTSECVQSYHVGLNKGFAVTKLERPKRPVSRKGKTSNRVREIRKIIQSVAEFSPFEKRVVEMYKTGVAQVEKRAFKLLRKRLGKRSRAIKKRDKIQQFIRASTAKKAPAKN